VQQNLKDLINDYNNINAVLALQSKQLANVKDAVTVLDDCLDALVQQQKERQEAEMTRREEINRILKRLLSFEKFVNESLLMKFQALEGGLSKTDSKVENLEQGLAEVENKVEQLGQEVKGRRTMDVKAALNDYSRALKASIKRQTEFQPKLLDLPSIFSLRTDEIFTNLLIQHGRKPVEDEDDMERTERLCRYGQVSGTRVKQCQEIFLRVGDDEKNPKSILLTGKAGIGKTVFCQKLIRDWADGQLFHSPANAQIRDFKFAFLMTFRQLSLLGDETLTLKELLNCSSLLDEQSDIDDSLFEYIISHPEEVLIIIDGFDEYLKQDYIAGDVHERYPNSAHERMPVAGLCAKLMRGKILGDSVVVITSRPDESDKIGGIRFDRNVEITGFSEPEVKEFIEKYFREDFAMKNIVLEHIMKNENLVSVAHIPVLCALMCSYMEYSIKESSKEDLPVSTSDLFFEVLNIFELKHNKRKSSHFDENILDKLSEFAAGLLLEKKFLFSDGDMKNLTSQEVESLRASGLLHCGPPFRVSFSQTTKHYCFTHLTLHEYLAARWFVKRREVPLTENVSEMVLQFMAGILSKKKDSQLMKKLLRGLPAYRIGSDCPLLLEAKCLYEYQDEQFAKDYYRQYPFRKGSEFEFSRMNDVDCIAVSFWLDILSALNEEAAAAKNQTFVVVHKALIIYFANLTVSGVKRICKSLEKDSSDITTLLLDFQMTDACVAKLCETLKHPSCKVTTLDLSVNQITDAGAVSLCEALKHQSCKVTTLDLTGNEITDAGVARLCEALKHRSCKVTTLDLTGNQITDAGVASLCEALKHPSCKVTRLHLNGNKITDAGGASLCEALNHPNCKVTRLHLNGNKITDAGVASLCEALKHPSCKVTRLHLNGNEITDAGVASLCEALNHPNCKVTRLHLNRNQITDAGVTSLCVALNHPSCKVTTLDLSRNQITNAGDVSLCEAIMKPSCNLTTLNIINFNRSGEQRELVRNRVKKHKPDHRCWCCQSM